jgi:CRISPR/Cas system endoribonuclease Cas6 (RAMP superfamily)
MLKIRELIIRFENEVDFKEIEALRGSILNTLTDDCDILFHNHIGDGFRYSYPLIQYKRINKKAAILCLQKGVDTIGTLLTNNTIPLKTNTKEETLKIESVNAFQYTIQVWDTAFVYTIRKWLALNEENYEKYKKLDSLKEKCEMLEKVLTANIIAFAKGVEIQIEKDIECVITELREPKEIRYKGVYFMAFDCSFKTNISLPDYIGLGKGVSLGFGMVKRMNNNKQENDK